MILFYTGFLVVSISCVATVTSSDFPLKEDSCSKFDNCYSKPPLRTCSCDDNCHVYGTCCQDLKKSLKDLFSDTFHCYNRRTVTPVFAKRSCSDDYRGHVADVAACLDDDEDEMDVVNNLLVTSQKTKITYWNTHCAKCNNEAKNDLELWNIEVFCPSHKDVDRNLIRRNLTFDQDKSQWGLHIGGEFVQCVVKYAPPHYIDEVKHCTPNLISSCPGDYSNRDIVKKCWQYYAERKLENSDTYYKNIYCAVCNGVDVKKLECPGMFRPEDNADETDFKEMVEEVFTKGVWLHKEPGKLFECSKGYAYDAFRVKCRRDTSLDITETIPNSSHTFKNGFLALLMALLVFICY